MKKWSFSKNYVSLQVIIYCVAILIAGCPNDDGLLKPISISKRSSALSGQFEERELCEFAIYGTQAANVGDVSFRQACMKV